MGGWAGIDMVIKNWKVRPFVVLLKKHEKRFRFRFFFVVFLHFGGAEEDMAARLSLVVISFSFFFFLVKRPQWLSESLWWVNCFLFFVAVVGFFKIDPEHSHETFFFSFKFFFWSSISIFLKLLSSLTCITMMAFKSWRGNMGMALPGRHATPTSLDQVVVAKTKHAALFFFLNPRLYIYFCLIWFLFSRTFLKKHWYLDL